MCEGGGVVNILLTEMKMYPIPSPSDNTVYDSSLTRLRVEIMFKI